MLGKIRAFIQKIEFFIRWFIRYLLNPKTKVYVNMGKKVVVIGNGPSAKLFPYNKYDGYEMCCVNFFALDEERFFSIKPSYYCCIDPVFSQKNSHISEKVDKLFAILNRVNWNMVFICFNGSRIPITNKYIKIHYINNNYYGGDITKLKNYLFNKNKASCGFQNVVVAAIYYFIMSKAAVIKLTGVENDWHRELTVDENNNVYRDITHFYGIERINLTQIGEIAKGELYKYFYYYYLTLYQYNILASYAKKNSVIIENTCLNSFIDVFDKVQL